ncbi:hypothetical protein [Kitasatospora sp. NBC_01266]|uniref:hypothetical protein n=1 Tax=Kitasatospora sp. NBC_01266 TaxID=2903572 RepID=UPI002E2F8E28|nr:hypothetical protein [Kitasatospora sp. NBC_01266]
MTTIAARAREAAAHLHTARTTAPEHRKHATARARARLRIATLLALAPTAITTETDDQRTTELNTALILSAADPADPGAVYRFSILDPRFHDDTLHLLRPCPACGGEVPVREVRTVVDLADAHRPVDIPADSPLPAHLADAFADDPGHRTPCPAAP